MSFSYKYYIADLSSHKTWVLNINSTHFPYAYIIKKNKK